MPYEQLIKKCRFGALYSKESQTVTLFDGGDEDILSNVHVFVGTPTHIQEGEEGEPETTLESLGVPEEFIEEMLDTDDGEDCYCGQTDDGVVIFWM